MSDIPPGQGRLDKTSFFLDLNNFPHVARLEAILRNEGAVRAGMSRTIPNSWVADYLPLSRERQSELRHL